MTPLGSEPVIPQTKSLQTLRLVIIKFLCHLMTLYAAAELVLMAV
jgi:hypothetical protein